MDETAQRLGCQRAVWNPDRLHMKAAANDEIADLLRVLRKEGELN
jgi:hypothetical protein